MLKALQQIEARSPQQRSEPAPDERPSPKKPRWRDEVPPEEKTTAPGGTVVDSAAVEAALARVEVAAAQASDGPVDEHLRAYGELADSILSRLVPNRGASLMFTSPGDGDGKTETLVSLASALAQRITGNVLLVDGNLRAPAVAGRLGVEALRGLADVLLGAATWPQVVRKTVVPRLSVLPGVRLPARDGWPPERLNLARLLEELRGEYELVLIDTASLAHSEVAPIARHCDGTYLVVRLGVTTRRTVREAAKAIRDCHGRVLGSVVIGG